MASIMNDIVFLCYFTLVTVCLMTMSRQMVTNDGMISQS
jgi:hypothetical protein